MSSGPCSRAYYSIKFLDILGIINIHFIHWLWSWNSQRKWIFEPLYWSDAYWTSGLNEKECRHTDIQSQHYRQGPKLLHPHLDFRNTSTMVHIEIKIFENLIFGWTRKPIDKFCGHLLQHIPKCFKIKNHTQSLLVLTNLWYFNTNLQIRRAHLGFSKSYLLKTRAQFSSKAPQLV